MRANRLLVTLAFVCTAAASPALAQSQHTSGQRMQMVSDCVAQAQRRVAPSGSANDPEYNKRYNVYAACMHARGERP